jgi:hypothetical protein
MYDNECGAVCGMSGRENRSTRRKPAPVQICPPQIPQDLSWDRTQVAAVGNRQVTALAMARLLYLCDRVPDCEDLRQIAGTGSRLLRPGKQAVTLPLQ